MSRDAERVAGWRVIAAAAVGAAALCGGAYGQGAASAPGATVKPTVGRVVIPQRETLLKMSRPVTIQFQDTRMEEVVKFLKDLTGADLEPLWTDDRAEGLDRDATVSMNVNNMSALEFLEQVLEKVSTDFQQMQWQMTSYGALEFGPKDRLNRRKTTKVYDISDLLTVLPNYPDAPQIDLQSVLQQSQGGGGGGGQSPFRDDEDDEEMDRPTLQERADELIDIITTLVETEQWESRGGTGGFIRYFQGSLIVRAPDYMHRQLGGYDYWPQTTVRTSPAGRRYVSLDMDTSTGKVDGIEQFPVTGVAGGGPGGAGGGG